MSPIIKELAFMLFGVSYSMKLVYLGKRLFKVFPTLLPVVLAMVSVVWNTYMGERSNSSWPVLLRIKTKQALSLNSRGFSRCECDLWSVKCNNWWQNYGCVPGILWHLPVLVLSVLLSRYHGRSHIYVNHTNAYFWYAWSKPLCHCNTKVLLY